jgi:hypothetical protein
LCYCAVLERAEVRLREAVEIARGLEAACAAKDAALTRALDLCDDAYCKNGSGGPEDCATCAAIKAALGNTLPRLRALEQLNLVIRERFWGGDWAARRDAILARLDAPSPAQPAEGKP